MRFQQLAPHLALCLVLTGAGYAMTRLMAFSVRIMDHPNERSSHSFAIPKSGGIAIVATFAIGMLMVLVFGEIRPIQQQYLAGFLISSLLVAAIALYDDILNKPLKVKLLSQLIAVFIALWSGIVIDRIGLPWLGQTPLGWLGYPLSFLWIIGLTNAANFMDGIDGLMGGVAVIATLFFVLITYEHGSQFVLISCYSILAGALGFLFLNFPPAKIFMGDVGSAFLGFTFATLAILAARDDGAHIPFLVMPLLVFNVVFDTVFTFLRRLACGEDVFKAHRSHLYQILVRLGHSHRRVTLLHYGMCLLQGLGALWMVAIPEEGRLLVFLPFLALQLLYSRWVMGLAKRAQLAL